MKKSNLRVKLKDQRCMPYKHLNGAAWDLRSNEETFILKVGMTKKVGTGVFLQQDYDTCALILPRSGLGAEYGLHLRNTVGLIDPDYTGELFISLNTKKEIEIKKYDRIAQILFLPFIEMVNILVTDIVPETERGAGGFGSSGVK